MRTIRTKFGGRCRICKQKVEVGAEVLWEQGVGITHESCHNRQVAEGLVRMETSAAIAQRHAEDYPETQQKRRDDSEVAKGEADARRYHAEVAIYGQGLADKFAQDDWMRDYNAGEAYTG